MHPDKSAEAGTLDSSNEDEMPIFNAILAYLFQLCKKTKQNKTKQCITSFGLHSGERDDLHGLKKA